MSVSKKEILGIQLSTIEKLKKEYWPAILGIADVVLVLILLWSFGKIPQIFA